MSDVKKEIIFSDSMTIDKRNEDFAYLRKNCFNPHYKGLYPSVDFTDTQTGGFIGGDEVMDVIGHDEYPYNIKVISERSGDLRFRILGTTTQANVGLPGVRYECAAFGKDGVYMVGSNNQLYRLQHVNTDSTSVYTFPNARPNLAGNDGLYYWWISPNQIYRQLGTASPTVAFNNVGMTCRRVELFNDDMVLFAEDANIITVLFWDKSNTDLFKKRIRIPNAGLVATGVVDGRLMMVKSIANRGNTKERYGELVVCAYDGEKFVRLNSIRTAQDDTTRGSGTGAITSCDSGNEIMMFSVSENTGSNQDDLFKNYVYKVKRDGQIEVATLPDATIGETHIVRIFRAFNVYAQRGSSTVVPVVAWNKDSSTTYSNYSNFNDTVYITNFLCNPYNDHRLDGFNVAFEKLFEQTDVEYEGGPLNGEYLDVYYRVSERDQWTLLVNVTPEKVRDNVNLNRNDSAEYASDYVGMHEQRYQVTKMPDGTPLPDFNEIQFKFVSKRGFSLIGAWFSYSYLSRNTLN